jgi:hypothetical protein
LAAASAWSMADSSRAKAERRQSVTGGFGLDMVAEYTFAPYEKVTSEVATARNGQISREKCSFPVSGKASEKRHFPG